MERNESRDSAQGAKAELQLIYIKKLLGTMLRDAIR